MPIDVTCFGCNKRFRLSDDFAGKRFKCKGCGEVLSAPMDTKSLSTSDAKPETPRPQRSKSGTPESASMPTPQRSRNQTSGSPSPKKKRRSAADLDPIPDPFADDYDKPAADSVGAFDDDLGGEYGDDYTDEYATPLPKKRKKKKKKKATRPQGFKQSKQKPSFADGLPPMTFNLNRLNGGLVIVGCILIFSGIKELRLAVSASSTAKEVSLEALYADGAGDDVFLTITGVQPVTDFYVATETKFGQMSEIWYACTPAGGDPQPHVLIYSTDAHTEDDVGRLMASSTHTGMLVSNVTGLDSETKNLFKQNVPGINVNTPLIFHVGRSPSGILKWGGFLLGGLVLLLGGLFWILFVHD
jgi:hypothetical protein